MNYQRFLKLALKYTKNQQDAEDVLQDAALNYYLSPTKPENEVAYFKRCLFTAFLQFKRRCITQSKFTSKEYEFNQHILTYTDPENTDFTPLYSAICTLDPGQRSVINQVLEGRSYKQCSGNYNTVKAHYRQAIANLRKGLGADNLLTINE